MVIFLLPSVLTSGILLRCVNETTLGFKKAISLHFGTLILGFMWKEILNNEEKAI